LKIRKNAFVTFLKRKYIKNIIRGTNISIGENKNYANGSQVYNSN
jgi:hypothetical protein